MMMTTTTAMSTKKVSALILLLSYTLLLLYQIDCAQYEEQEIAKSREKWPKVDSANLVSIKLQASTQEFLPDKSFTLNCILEFGDAFSTSDFDYTVSYLYKSISGKEEETFLAFWDVGSQENSEFYSPNSLVAMNITKGNLISTSYEIIVEPKSLQAEGSYLCAVDFPADQTAASVKSNSEQIMGKTDVSVEIDLEKNVKILTLGEEFRTKCRASGTYFGGAEFYTVEYFLKKDNDHEIPILLGSWEVERNPDNYAFVPGANLDQFFNYSKVPGSQNHEMALSPKSLSLNGSYAYCRVSIQDGFNRTEMTSELQKLDIQLGYESTFSSSLVNFQVGVPFRAQCKVGGGDLAQESDFEVNFYYKSLNPQKDDKTIGTWKISNGKAKFSGGIKVSEFTVVENKAAFPDYRIQITPNSIDAQGSFYCSLVVPNAFQKSGYTSNEAQITGSTGNQASCLVSPQQFEIGKPFSVLNIVYGPKIESAYFYHVLVYFTPNSTYNQSREIVEDEILVGRWEVFPRSATENFIYFESNAKLLKPYFTVADNYALSGSDFELLITPTSLAAEGTYECRIYIHNSADSVEQLTRSRIRDARFVSLEEEKAEKFKKSYPVWYSSNAQWLQSSVGVSTLLLILAFFYY